MHPEALSQLSGLSRGLPGFWNTPPFHLWWQRPLPAGHTRLRGAGEDRPLTVSFVHHGMDDHWKHAPVQVKVQLRKKGGEGSETGWRRSAKQAGGPPPPHVRSGTVSTLLSRGGQGAGLQAHRRGAASRGHARGDCLEEGPGLCMEGLGGARELGQGQPRECQLQVRPMTRASASPPTEQG